MKQINASPLSFKPYLKEVIWGGSKICTYKGMEADGKKIGESWEISVIPGHESVVDAGQYSGKNLSELADIYGESLLGAAVTARHGNNFPLLIKIIDANDNLSVQVHPNDELARLRHNAQGKTEMWYIIDAEPGAKIISGLNRDSSPQEYEQTVADGTFMDLLALHDSEPGDVFFLPAGRVHSISAGNLLAEIQESSDITYRIFDYNRRDAAGNTRELHTELAKDAIDYKFHSDYKSPKPDSTESDACIADCDCFTVRRIFAEGERDLSLSPDSFAVLMCLKGECTLKYPSGESHMRAGKTFLLPAVLCADAPLKLSGKATLLTAQTL